MSNQAAAECQKPLVAKDLAQPLPPILSSIVNQDDTVQIEWEFEPISANPGEPAILPPDGFLIRLSTTRDFEEEKLEPNVVGSNARTAIVQLDAFLWLLEAPLYMQVSAYRSSMNVNTKMMEHVQSEWSTATEPWVLADTCDNDEFLAQNHTTTPGKNYVIYTVTVERLEETTANIFKTKIINNNF